MEGEVGYFRRNHWVPVPQALDVADLHRQLLASCREDERRTIAGREQSVGVGLVVGAVLPAAKVRCMAVLTRSI